MSFPQRIVDRDAARDLQMERDAVELEDPRTHGKPTSFLLVAAVWFIVNQCLLLLFASFRRCANQIAF